MKIEATSKVKKGLAEMLKGGVIMDVVNAEQAVIAEKSGAVAVMALERIPADIRAEGGVARMSSVGVIQEVMDAVSIPVMAKARIGHFVEAQIIESIGIDFIDESEVLTPADEVNHINKNNFKTPFVCGATGLGEATRRIAVSQKLLPLVMSCRYDKAMVLTVCKILVILTKPLSEDAKRAGRLTVDVKSKKVEER